MAAQKFISGAVKKLLSWMVGLILFTGLNTAIIFPAYAASPSEPLHENIVIYMVVEGKLKDVLQPLDEKVAKANQQSNVKNTFHMSLIHLTHHVFTPQEFNALLDNVREEVAESVHPFEFTADSYAFLDEDKDVGLSLNMKSFEYENLMAFVKNIPLPKDTEVKEYKPHITVYYGVKDEYVPPVEEVLKNYKFDTDKKYTVTEIAVGDLGEKNNLIRPIAKFPLVS